MDVKITILTGGGRKANAMSHSYTFKEVNTVDEVKEGFEREFKPFFPAYQTLDKTPSKKAKKE
jgi:inorganic pyrophosphatase